MQDSDAPLVRGKNGEWKQLRIPRTLPSLAVWVVGSYKPRGAPTYLSRSAAARSGVPVARLAQYLKKYRRVRVFCVPEHYTSQRCNHCLERFDPSRHDPATYGLTTPHPHTKVRGLRKCKTCGAIVDRDTNAARNIRAQWMYYCLHGRWHPLLSPLGQRRRSRTRTTSPAPT